MLIEIEGSPVGGIITHADNIGIISYCSREQSFLAKELPALPGNKERLPYVDQLEHLLSLKYADNRIDESSDKEEDMGNLVSF
jgi:hypothetical protein